MKNWYTKKGAKIPIISHVCKCKKLLKSCETPICCRHILFWLSLAEKNLRNLIKSERNYASRAKFKHYKLCFSRIYSQYLEKALFTYLKNASYGCVLSVHMSPFSNLLGPSMYILSQKGKYSPRCKVKYFITYFQCFQNTVFGLQIPFSTHFGPTLDPLQVNCMHAIFRPKSRQLALF